MLLSRNFQTSRKHIHLHLLLCLIFITALTSCVTFQSAKNQDEHVETNINEKDVFVNSEDQQIKAKEAKIYAWWWDSSDVEKGIDGDNPPAKNNYIEIEKWQYDGEGIKTYPHEVDFVAKVANDSLKSFQGVVKFKISAKFEDYEKLYYRDKSNDSIKFNSDEFEKLSWTNKAKIFEEKITIETNQEKQLAKKDFNLKNLLNQKENGKPISALRFSVEIFDTLGNKLDEKEKIILVILGD